MHDKDGSGVDVLQQQIPANSQQVPPETLRDKNAALDFRNHFSYKTQRNKRDYRQYDRVSESLLIAEPRAQDR